MRIDAAYDLFIRDRLCSCSVKTIETYKSHFGIFFAYVSSDTDFESLPENFFEEYVLYLRSKDIKNVTVRSYCRPIKAFLRFCYERDFCKDFLKHARLPKDDSIPPEPLLQNEVLQLDAALEGRLRNYCIVHLMLDCGLRSEEVVNLKIGDLDLDNHLVKVKLSKGCKSRIVFLPDFLLQNILKYIGDRKSGSLFIQERGNGVLTENSIKMLFQKLKTSSGVPRIHAHLLRHTFATAYLIQGGNLEFLRVLMGHYDYTVTKVYSSLAAQYKMLHIPVYKLDSIFFQD